MELGAKQIEVEEITRESILMELEKVALMTAKHSRREKLDDIAVKLAEIFWDKGEELLMVTRQQLADEKNIVGINYE